MQSIPGDSLAINRRRRTFLSHKGPYYRAPLERVLDFSEVVLPFDEERAKFEASRCIHCPDPAPCVTACPVHNDIPSAMWLIEKGKFEEAYELYLKTSYLPSICGRVCPHEDLCEGSCVLNKDSEPVLCGLLEAFAADYTKAKRTKEGRQQHQVRTNNKRVAVVGSGPAGLGCAERLLRRGYQVTVFDTKPAPGGLLSYGIPSFKLPRNVIGAKITQLTEMGVEFIGSTFVGRDKMVHDLFEDGYQAVFLGIGTWVDAVMGIPGEDMPGVYKGSGFLILANSRPEDLPEDMNEPFEIGKKLCVIGGGDTASDCLRTALRMNAEEVVCLYRRTEKEMPGNKKDRSLAREEGAKFEFLVQPVRFIAGEDGRLKEIECVRNQLGEPDAKGRRRPVEIPGSNFTVEADMAVLAVGYWPDETIRDTTEGLETKKWGEIQADPRTGRTSIEGVYAGGDAVTGPDLVVTAMAGGRRAAEAIDNYLSGVPNFKHAFDDDKTVWVF